MMRDRALYRCSLTIVHQELTDPLRAVGQLPSPYISHYLCMIWQICEERCLLFADAVRRGIWRRESA